MSHEYGHFVADVTLGFDYLDNSGFHEGYCDILSLFHHNPLGDIIGRAGFGCSSSGREDVRDWIELDTGWTSSLNCGGSYQRAQRLVLIWRELRDSIGLSAASQLFVDWSLITTPEPFPRSCIEGSAYDLSARDATYFEVLLADDDNNNLSDGTPHDAEICAAFTAYGLPEDTEIDCPDGTIGGHCPIDFDQDGQFSVKDLMIFNDWLLEGSDRADLNQDGRADLFDQLELMRLASQCP